MADVLSQSEVEALLAALDPGINGGRKPGEGSSPNGPYDLHRPEPVSPQQRRAVQTLHEAFSREFAAALTGTLRTNVDVKFTGLDQVTYGEFVGLLENPTCLSLLKSDRPPGDFVLELNPSIIFPIVDRLLGGGREPRQSFPERPLTEIELRLVSRIIHLAIQAICRTWSSLRDVNLTVSQTESNPQLVQNVVPDEPVLLGRFEITLTESRGIMNLCLPLTTIESLAGEFWTGSRGASSPHTVAPNQKPALQAGGSRTQVEMIVRLAETRLSAEELRDLAVGDVIVTEKNCQEGIQVAIDGESAFLGYPGLYEGRKAVRLGAPIPDSQDSVHQKLRQLASRSPQFVVSSGRDGEQSASGRPHERSTPSRSHRCSRR